MPTVADIVAALGARTLPARAASWDPVGLQLGNPGADVSSIAVCHETSETVVDAVAKDGIDLLISYHPLLFAPVNRLVAGRSPAARAMRLLEAGANLLITHTDFDACPGGSADALAASLNLTDIEPFGANEEEGRAEIGRVGTFGLTLEALDAAVADLWGSNGLRVSGDRDAVLDRVAVVPGSGSDLIVDALPIADAIVTGDVGHHRVVAAMDQGLAVVDPGHIATERPGMEALVNLVGETTEMTVIDLTDHDPTTWS